MNYRRVLIIKPIFDKGVGDVQFVNDEQYKYLKKGGYVEDYTPPYERKKILIEGLNNLFNKFITLLQQEKYNDAENLLSFSDSGDGYGGENYFLDVSILSEKTIGLVDLMDLIELIRKLDKENNNED